MFTLLLLHRRRQMTVRRYVCLNKWLYGSLWWGEDFSLGMVRFGIEIRGYPSPNLSVRDRAPGSLACSNDILRLSSIQNYPFAHCPHTYKAVLARGTYRSTSLSLSLYLRLLKTFPAAPDPLLPRRQTIIFVRLYGIPLESQRHHLERRKREQVWSTEATVDASPPTFVTRLLKPPLPSNLVQDPPGRLFLSLASR